MAKYNFETRELVPYREDWNRGGNVKISGALWYIKEKDGLYLKIDEDKVVGKAYLTHDYCVAKGLPAALLAQGDELVHPDFNFVACYQAYFKAIKDVFPTKPAYNIPTVLEDWEWTLQQSFPIDHNISGYLDNFSMMAVACFIRDLSNPYNKTKGLVDQINNSYYYTCNFASKDKTQIIFSQMPTVADRTEAPLIFASDIDQPMSKAVLQADGFIAAIINIAFLYFWKKRWSEYNFTNVKVVENVLQTCMRQKHFVDTSALQHLSFDLPIEVEEICKAYMEAFMPIMQKVWKLSPNVQLACIEGDNIYTYIYAHESASPERLTASELYANLSDHQKRNLLLYNKRFMEWLVKTYHITTASQHRVMQAMCMDMPPIQLTIHNDIQVTHTNEEQKKEVQKKSSAKFSYIITDDEKEMLKIHKRIELHLSSPAKLRDELARLQDEGLVSLPKDNPTAIIRAVHEVWGNRAPKERSFVTTWGRRF